MRTSTICPKCQQEKPVNRGYCNACATKAATEYYYRKKGMSVPERGPDWKHKSDIPKPLLCASCGKDREQGKVYCEECRQEKFVENKHRSNQKLKGKKKKAHKAVGLAMSVGMIVRTACETCGSEKAVDAHHSSYDHPLAVTWLCRICHTKLHRDFEKSLQRGILSSIGDC